MLLNKKFRDMRMIKSLIDQLGKGEIEKLQGQYVAFIQQLQIIQENCVSK